jgi:DNA-binding NarL/FixJ family response regulator
VSPLTAAQQARLEEIRARPASERGVQNLELSFARGLASAPPPPREPRPNPTRPSRRELQVFELIADGFTDAEIGRVLRVTEHTVKTHVRHLLAKLEARNRTQLVALGFRRGHLI